MNQVFICDAIRTPFGRYGGALSAVRTDDLAAMPIKALMARNPSVDWQAVTDVLLGCVNQAVKTTAMWRAWPVCSRDCHTKCRGRRSIDCAARGWMPLGQPPGRFEPVRPR